MPLIYPPHPPHLNRSKNRIAKRRNINPNIVRKLFDADEAIPRNKQTFLVSKNFIDLLYATIEQYKNNKTKEFDTLEYTKMQDNSISHLEADYKQVIGHYELSLIELKKLREDKFEAKDAQELEVKQSLFNPGQFVQTLNETRTILAKTLYKPLKHVDTENSFMHSLKMMVSNFAEKLGFGKTIYQFFRPKPTFCDELNAITTSTKAVEQSVNQHLGIV